MTNQNDEIKPCPLCGSKDLRSILPRTCGYCGFTDPQEAWETFYCWKREQELIELVREIMDIGCKVVDYYGIVHAQLKGLKGLPKTAGQALLDRLEVKMREADAVLRGDKK